MTVAMRFGCVGSARWFQGCLLGDATADCKGMPVDGPSLGDEGAARPRMTPAPKAAGPKATVSGLEDVY